VKLPSESVVWHARGTMEWLKSTLWDIHERHEALKKRVHSFRIPLSPTGIRIAQCVYFSIPVIGGYYVMQWAIGKSHENIGRRGEQLRAAAEGSVPHAGGTAGQNAVLAAQLAHARRQREGAREGA
jgi:hypothetical protein